MGRRLYVGNLGYAVTQTDLTTMFEAHGTVESAQVIMDRETGRSKGFGFVEMKTDGEAQAAITGLNGKDEGGRALTVNEAKPRTEGGRGGSGGRGDYGRGDHGGNGGGQRY
jgi:RNA recognition motif-containing protein